ncbi:hypothetical protein B9T31_12440 [Acinetobacter sp. ANC 4558]|uniref:lysozyme inhibitor LprI family protein n=1 Tax=Acinetobacter sp. ANC 4558 TaxID=1977876 RepID=UPI000A33AFA7|nr:lysozyme inhibitor LprI family protein [Acinetobacter sp. ANC 4558]OTG85280.1 hypothetical protein B9T31_12440 [Acinetobacter sp. ANC 4558]
MKNLFFLSLLLLSTHIGAANCEENAGNFAEVVGCLNNEVSVLKEQLNKTYINLYMQTKAKTKLEVAQKSWNDYKEKQCDNFSLAEVGPTSTQMAISASCEIELIQNRITFLKSITQ